MEGYNEKVPMELPQRTESSDNPQLNERGPNQYENFLGVRIEELNNKNVLNIGSGKAGLFEKSAAEHGARVFTISPFFANKGLGGKMMREQYLQRPFLNKIKTHFNLPGAQKETYPIAARAEEGIPIGSETMDIVTALYSVPLYLSEVPEENENLFSEIYRVLKDGGRGILYPIPESRKSFFSELLKTLSIQQIKFVEIQEETDTVYPGQICYRLEIIK